MQRLPRLPRLPRLLQRQPRPLQQLRVLQIASLDTTRARVPTPWTPLLRSGAVDTDVCVDDVAYEIEAVIALLHPVP